MLRIGICDDSEADRAWIRDKIGSALFDYEDVRIIIYDSGQRVIEAIDKGEYECELLVLDIMMNPVDGMQVADYIRKNRIDTDIIFVTQSSDYVYQGYVYKAFSYILKQRVENELAKEICRYVDEWNASDECLNITVKGEPCRVPISSIQYVESNRRILILHLAKDDIAFYAKMSDLEKLLCERGFIRVHQSYMVRQSVIRKLTRDSVELDCGIVPVSRKYYAQVKSLFEKQGEKNGKDAR